MTKIKETAIQGLELARACARWADEKQALDIQILDLRGLSQVADYFVVCSGTSFPHLRAIRDEIDQKIRENHGVRPTYREGVLESQWMVLDYIDVLVHVFREEKREFYDLEGLWSDSVPIDWRSGTAIAD